MLNKKSARNFKGENQEEWEISSFIAILFSCQHSHRGGLNSRQQRCFAATKLTLLVFSVDS